jgi:pentatricopeptide repeat protein
MATPSSPSEPARFELDDFVEFFFHQPEPWILWLGSYVSIERPAAVPGVGAILDALAEELSRGDEPAVPEAAALLTNSGDLFKVLRERDVPFEVILGQAYDHTGLFVTGYLQQTVPASAQPNPNHRAAVALALGAARAPVGLVITTNFDECLEAASGHRFTVSSPQQGPFEIPTSPGLLKVHGTISDPASLGVTPAALAKRDTLQWRTSLASSLAGRNVLFVGYGFRDTFDVTPALLAAAQAGARFYWACSDGELTRRVPVPITARIPHDLRVANRNLLRCLVPEAASGYGDPDGFAPEDQLETARRGCAEALADIPLPVAAKLAALGALHYWLEHGRAAVKYFAASSRCPGSHVDRQLLARAYSRSRRFRAAVRLFDLMLREDLPKGELPTDKVERVKRAIDWHVGAGFCAATGGRPVQAARHYRQARAAFNQAKREGILDERRLGPYLADQLLRSQAAEEVRLARWHGGRDRDRHLERAGRYLDRLEAIGGLELATRPLVVLDRALLELARGNRAVALQLLEDANIRIDRLRDPHVSSVCKRLRAIAARDRHAQAKLAAEAWDDGRRLEWAKIQVERLGLDGYTRVPTLTYAARSLLLAGWDLCKDVLQRVE